MKSIRTNRCLFTACGAVLIACGLSGCNTLALRESPRTLGIDDLPDPPAAESVSNEKSVENAPEPTVSTASHWFEDSEDSTSPIEPAAATNDVDNSFTISLYGAVASALSNNLHLKVLVDLPDEAGKRIQMERAFYDTSFNTNMQYLSGNQQVASALQTVQGGLSQYGTTSFGPVPGNPNLMSVEQRFSTGTTARVGLGSNYNYNSPIGQYLIYNPAYQSAGSLIVEQALFRGASRDANLAGIRIAQAGHKQSGAEFQVEVNQTLSEIHRAYWTVWLTESQEDVYEELVDQAQSTCDLESKRLELGKGGAVSVAQANENLHSLKAELSQTRQRGKAARNHLFYLMGVSSQDRRPMHLVDLPLQAPITPDLEHGFLQAVQNRPEVQVRQLQIAQAQLELERRKNNNQPDVRAYAGYSLTGLNNNLMGSVNSLTSAEFGNWNLGVRYSHVLGRRAERAAVEQAQMALARQIRARQETEFLIQQQVRDAFDAIHSSWDVLQSQTERVAAARVQAHTFHELYAAGQIDLDRLLRARQQLAQALPQWHQAVYQYNLAINNWQYALGEMTTSLAPAPEIPRVAEASDQ